MKKVQPYYTKRVTTLLVWFTNEPHLLSRRAQGGVSVFVWADFNSKWKTSSVFTKINSVDHQGILRNNFVLVNHLMSSGWMSSKYTNVKINTNVF